MAKQKIIKFCETCQGTGKLTVPSSSGPAEIECAACIGAGKVEWGYLKEKEGD